jgi:hypothetical protein
VYQGVHDTFEIREHTAWGENEPRTNKLVFIGRDLDPRYIVESFNSFHGTQMTIKRAEDFDNRAPSFSRLVVMAILLLSVVYPEQSWNLATSPLFITAVIAAVILYIFYLRNKK